jgi:hypothetical protein
MFGGPAAFDAAAGADSWQHEALAEEVSGCQQYFCG